MTKNQMFTSAKNWFSLEYPKMWEVQLVENIPAFFDPIWGQGALQVFSAKIGQIESEIPESMREFSFLRGNDLTGKMLHFLKEQNIQPEQERLNVYVNDDMNILPYEYQIQERFYMACMLQRKNIFLLALYNCERTPSEEEAKTIGEIIKSIDIIV